MFFAITPGSLSSTVPVGPGQPAALILSGCGLETIPPKWLAYYTLSVCKVLYPRYKGMSGACNVLATAASETTQGTKSQAGITLNPKP